MQIHYCVHSENGHNMRAQCGAELDPWESPPNWTFNRADVTCSGCNADLPEYAGGCNNTAKTDAGKPDEPYPGYRPPRDHGPNYDTHEERAIDFERDYSEDDY